MKLKKGTEAEYEEYKSKNTDPYGGRVVSYGEDWANFMEREIGDLTAFNDIEHVLKTKAQSTSREADTDGITGFMYGCAVNALAHFWEYGEILRRWHNLDSQLGNEGERANNEPGATLNPALLNISTKGN